MTPQQEGTHRRWAWIKWCAEAWFNAVSYVVPQITHTWKYIHIDTGYIYWIFLQCVILRKMTPGLEMGVDRMLGQAWSNVIFHVISQITNTWTYIHNGYILWGFQLWDIEGNDPWTRDGRGSNAWAGVIQCDPSTPSRAEIWTRADDWNTRWVRYQHCFHPNRITNGIESNLNREEQFRNWAGQIDHQQIIIDPYKYHNQTDLKP